MLRSLTDPSVGMGEPELDANSALNELDKGLRSDKLGERCEAIVRFPNLFEKYPFPILINSAFLKLADVFRNSSNFIRIWVLRVCQQSERHLDKIINVDEFIKRIFTVMHSNDPVARALTLRTLGSLAGLIPERKSVHHCIRASLNSSDSGEVVAAIYAASCFARRSKTFATTMYTNISSMIKRITTPNELKLKLIPIFKHMHHDVSVASTVLAFCKEILESFPSKDFVVVTLHSMTELAAATISDLKDQVSFLLGYLHDPREEVKASVLGDLKLLAIKGGHLWDALEVSMLLHSVMKRNTPEDAMDIEETAIAVKDDSLLVHHTLDILRCLASSPALPKCLGMPDSPLKTMLETCVQSSDRGIVIKAILLASSIAVSWKPDQSGLHDAKLDDMVKNGLDSVIRQLCDAVATEMSEADVKRYYDDWEKCVAAGVSVCRAVPGNVSWFGGILVHLLLRQKLPKKTRTIICEGIGALGSTSPDSLQDILPELFSILESFTPEQIAAENTSVVILIAALLQAHQAFELGPRATSLCTNVLNNCKQWDRYRIARNALRYGQPGLAVTALDGMATSVSTENFYYWLSAVQGIAKGESALVDDPNVDLRDRLNTSTNLFLKAVMAVKASSSPTVSMNFQTEYIRIRSEMLVSFSNFLAAFNTLRLCPPPIIRASIANASRDELLKSGRVVTQLRKASRDFQTVSEMYGRLYQTAFDADNDTLTNLHVLQQICQLISKGIASVAYTKDHPAVGGGDHSFDIVAEGHSGALNLVIQSCQESAKILKNISLDSVQEVTLNHLETIQEALRLIIETPLPYPRFFFQNLQTTRVKIAVSPQPKVPGENVSVVLGNNLVLKVEGIIEQTFSGQQNGSDTTSSARPGFRKPKSIRMTVISSPASNNRTPDPMGKPNNEPSTIVKEVAPRKDFFSAQFLLGSWPSGLYTVTVDTSLIDYEGRVWMTGPRANLNIRALQESATNMAAQVNQQMAAAMDAKQQGYMMNSGNVPPPPMPNMPPRPGPSGVPVMHGASGPTGPAIRY